MGAYLFISFFWNRINTRANFQFVIVAEAKLAVHSHLPKHYLTANTTGWLEV